MNDKVIPAAPRVVTEVQKVVREAILRLCQTDTWPAKEENLLTSVDELVRQALTHTPTHWRTPTYFVALTASVCGFHRVHLSPDDCEELRQRFATLLP